MKIKVEIDSEDILRFTTASEDEQFIKEMLENVSDEILVDEIFKRMLIYDVLSELTEKELEETFAEYGYIKEE
jgi:hypothetical protein